jgi:hypothetical protein
VKFRIASSVMFDRPPPYRPNQEEWEDYHDMADRLASGRPSRRSLSTSPGSSTDISTSRCEMDIRSN